MTKYNDKLTPAEDAFLALIARNINTHPQNLLTLTPEMITKLREIIKDVEVDPDAPIEGDVCL